MREKLIALTTILTLLMCSGIVSAAVSVDIWLTNDGTTDYTKTVSSDCGTLEKHIENDGGMWLYESVSVDGGISDWEEFYGTGDTTYTKRIDSGAVVLYKHIENSGWIDVMEDVIIDCGDLDEWEWVIAGGETTIDKHIELWGPSVDPWFGLPEGETQPEYDSDRYDGEQWWQGEGAYLTAVIDQGFYSDEFIWVDEELYAPSIDENRWKLDMDTWYGGGDIDMYTDVYAWTVYPVENNPYPSGNNAEHDTDVDYYHDIYPFGGHEHIAINPEN